MFFQKGQVTVLALLIGLLGLTIGLSVASRSLSDLRQVSVVDQGTKALAAAEAGVQFALNQLSVNPGVISTCDPPNSQTAPTVLSNITGIKYNICSNNADYGVYSAVPQDDVIQINISGQGGANVKGFQILWKNPNASLEIIKITDGNTQTRYLYNSNSNSGADSNYRANTANNSFAPSVAGSNCYRASTCGDASFNNNTSSCAGFWGGGNDWEIPYNTGGSPSDKYIRIKPLYAGTEIEICSVPTGQSGGRLALQYYKITSIATTSGGVTRKIQTTSLSNVLPSIFDNVFYSGGSLAK